MSVPPNSAHPSVQQLQQDLLYQLAGVVPFAARAKGGELRISLNPALRRLFSVSAAPARLSGGPLLNRRVSADDIPVIRAGLARLIECGEHIELRYRMQCGDELRCFRLIAQPLSPGSERIIGAFQDCTVHAREEQQLRASQERLQSLGRLTLLGEVASGLSHELNQPLAAITTFAQAGERLLQLPEPRLEKAASVFKEISQQSLRAGDTLRHMRGLIKRRATHTDRVSAEQLMKDFLSLAEPVARVNQVKLQVSLDPTEKSVEVDVAQIHQALMILFQNALEASQQATLPGVRVELLAQPQGLELAIVDAGPGISAKVAAQLFQPFFSTKDQGTGLGLVSCRNILEAHASRLTYTNQPGGGCRFAFVLPYAA